MAYEHDPRVDDYIEGLPEWQQAICREVRELVHAADPEVAETIKRRVQPYFVLKGSLVPDPEGIMTGGKENKTARTVAIRAGERVNARALQRMFEQIIANNRAGGWRKLKMQG